MSNVTEFPNKNKNSNTGCPACGTHGPDEGDELVLVCHGCGCLTHYIKADHTIECANCGGFVGIETSEWHKHLPDVPTDTDNMKDTGGLVATTNLGSPELARKRVLKRIGGWDKAGELMLVAGYNRDGSGSHWGNFDSAENKDWVIEKLEALLASVRTSKVTGTTRDE